MGRARGIRQGKGEAGLRSAAQQTESGARQGSRPVGMEAGGAEKEDVVRRVAVSFCLGRDDIRGLGEPAEARLELYRHACRFICQGGLDPAPPPTE